MKFCNNCGKENKEFTKFCTGCGNSLSNPVNIPSQSQNQNPIYESTKNSWLILCIVALFGIFVGGICSYFLFDKKSTGSSEIKPASSRDLFENTTSPDPVDNNQEMKSPGIKTQFVYDKFQPFAIASSTYLMPGEEMAVTAGVGTLSTASKTSVTINGVLVGLNGNGVAEKKFNVSGIGNHRIGIVVDYTKPDGSPDRLVKDIEYTVGIPSGASVMPDKMNIFYIGVDNPITIGSSSSWDKTNVTISGAGSTITGAGSRRFVRVTSLGECNITVAGDNGTIIFPFRVKLIPDPIIKLGPSVGGRIQAVTMRNQAFIRADLENFDFQAKFNVIGATIYFINPGDRNVKQVSLSSGELAPAKVYMNQLVPGSAVIFENIRVVGPDGQQRTIQNPPGFSLF